MSDDRTDTTSLRAACEELLEDLARAHTEFRAPFEAFDGAIGPELLPDAGAGIEVVLGELRRAIDNGSALNAPGMLGWITTGGTTAPIVAELAGAVASGQRYLKHAFNHLEHIGLRWLADLCGLPVTAAGVFTSGGSTANLVGLGAARQAAYERYGVDVATAGQWGTPPGRIYGSELAHRTIHRSAAVLGLGRDRVTAIPTDGAGHLRVDALAAAIDADIAAGVVPIAAVAVAGTTDFGTIDPIAAIGEVARARGCWLHVDGAYGLIANASPSLAPRFAGVADADSWTVDPHKWLATGVGVGAVYVRDGAVLTRAFAEGHAEYLEGSFSPPDEIESEFDTMAGDWADQGVELSAPPRGARVWAVLREIGRAGVAARVDGHVALARALADHVVAHARLELLVQPELSVVCFRYLLPGGPSPGALNQLNEQIVLAMRRTTRLVPSTTMVNGAVAIRPCFINPRQTMTEVDDLVATVVEIGDRLSGG